MIASVATCFQSRGGRPGAPIPSLRSRRTRMSDMVLYPLNDLKRDGQRAPPILARHRDRRIAPDRGQETLQLATQRLLAVSDQRDAFDQVVQPGPGERHAGLERDAGAQAKELAGPRGQVQADVARTLE